MAITDDEDQPETRPTFQRHLIGLLDSYRQKLSTKKAATAKPKKEIIADDEDEIDADAVADAEADNDSTHADFPPPLLASDASMTIADTGAIIEFQSNIIESQFISETQAEESAVFDQTSFEGNHDMPSVKPTASVKTDPDNPVDTTDEDPEKTPVGDYTVGDRIDGRYEVSEVLRGDWVSCIYAMTMTNASLWQSRPSRANI